MDRGVAIIQATIAEAAHGWRLDRALADARAELRAKVAAKRARFPDLADDATLDGLRSIWDFDDVVTAPVHGFRDAADYYARASAGRELARIRVPALVLNARNDPFLPASALPRQDAVGPCVTLWQPAHGGHVGFATGGWPGRLRGLPAAVLDWLGDHATR